MPELNLKQKQAREFIDEDARISRKLFGRILANIKKYDSDDVNELSQQTVTPNQNVENQTQQAIIGDNDTGVTNLINAIDKQKKLFEINVNRKDLLDEMNVVKQNISAFDLDDIQNTYNALAEYITTNNTSLSPDQQGKLLDKIKQLQTAVTHSLRSKFITTSTQLNMLNTIVETINALIAKGINVNDNTGHLNLSLLSGQISDFVTEYETNLKNANIKNRFTKFFQATIDQLDDDKLTKNEITKTKKLLDEHDDEITKIDDNHQNIIVAGETKITDDYNAERILPTTTAARQKKIDKEEVTAIKKFNTDENNRYKKEVQTFNISFDAKIAAEGIAGATNIRELNRYYTKLISDLKDMQQKNTSFAIANKHSIAQKDENRSLQDRFMIDNLTAISNYLIIHTKAFASCVFMLYQIDDKEFEQMNDASLNEAIDGTKAKFNAIINIGSDIYDLVMTDGAIDNSAISNQYRQKAQAKKQSNVAKLPYFAGSGRKKQPKLRTQAIGMSFNDSGNESFI